MALTFIALQNAYPLGSREDLFNNVLQGNWPTLLNNDNYRNTCAIRMSVALDGAGQCISDAIWTADGRLTAGDGSRLLLKVTSMQRFFNDLLGPSTWGMSKNPDDPFDFNEIPAWTGILSYDFPTGVSLASGHVDLWTGSACVDGCPTLDVGNSYSIMLWRLP